MDMTDREISAVLSALEWARAFFVERDRMNAAVHCSLPRFSPVTDKVVGAYLIVHKLAMDRGVLDEMGG